MKTFIKTLTSLIFLLVALFFFNSKSAAATTIFFDNFNGPDGTPLTLHDSRWNELFGGVQLLNNKAQSNNSNAEYTIPDLIENSNYCVQEDFTFPLGPSGFGTFIGLSTRGQTTDRISHYSASVNDIGFIGISHDNTALYFQQHIIGNGIHSFKLCSINNNHSVYIDNNLITTVQDNTYNIGFPGFDLGNNVNIDNFMVSTVNNALDVPLLKQTGLLWGNNIYDFANKWSTKDTSISSWGCALTSAAMVFQYHGVKKLPNGSNLDPGTLNNWLKTQKDGYIRNGLVNWLALSRLSKLVKTINNLPFDALEYSRKNTSDHSILDADLNTGLPDILQEPGHFIVAKGINGTTYDINDPYYNRNLLTDHYNNNFSSIGTYKPSNTDLSYIMLVVNKGIDITVSGGNSSEGQVFQGEYINNAQNNNNNTEQLNVYYLPKPESGRYNIKLSSNSSKVFRLDEYLYDKDGNVSISKEKGRIKDKDENVVLTYPKPHPKKCTYVSTILDIHKGNDITDEKLKLNLTELLIKAKVQNATGNKEEELSYLDNFSELLLEHESSISPKKYSNLAEDIDYLSSSN